jgi:hypothetical protein
MTEYKLLGKDNPMRENNIRMLAIIGIIMLVVFVSGYNIGVPNDDDENKPIEVKEQWVLIKSDTIQSRASELKELGISSSDINDRVRNSSSVAQTHIWNYFTKNGRIKRMQSYN